MSKPFYEQPILNSPYHVPTRHHALDPQGQPLAQPPFEGRRRSKYLTPVPSSKKKKLTTQGELGLSTQQGEPGTYNENPIVNEIRGHLERWRSLPNPADWGVSPTTQRLLQHWRSHEFQGARPFFCQLEAVETAIWLAEVARGQRRYRALFDHLAEANADANPDLFRIALKLATGAGKTTVMAMLIAWQAINAVRQPGSKLFAKGFLIVAPGITIKDRLRVLNPSEEGSYYDSRELVPPDMMGDLRKARIVVTNYHVFQRRRVLEVNTVGERLMKSRLNDELEVLETEGEMLKRACGELLSIPGVVVINDEAHHCYRERVGAPAEEEGPLDREEAAEAKSNNEAARLWISGIEALARKIDVRGATIFRRRRSFCAVRAMPKARCSLGWSPTSRWSTRSNAASSSCRVFPSPITRSMPPDRSSAICGTTSASRCRRRGRASPATSIRAVFRPCSRAR